MWWTRNTPYDGAVGHVFAGSVTLSAFFSYTCTADNILVIKRQELRRIYAVLATDS